MGSFNVTCALSNMPIMHGDEAKILFLAEQPAATTVPSQHFLPIFPFFLDGTYNDYFRFNLDKSSPNYAYVEEFFKKKLISIEQGENEYHDHAVTPDLFTLENNSSDQNVFELIKEERLFIKNDQPWKARITGSAIKDMPHLSESHPCKVYVAAYRKDVLDKLFSGVYEYQHYVGSEDVTYRDVTFEEQIKNLAGSTNVITSQIAQDLTREFMTYVKFTDDIPPENADELVTHFITKTNEIYDHQGTFDELWADETIGAVVDEQFKKSVADMSRRSLFDKFSEHCMFSFDVSMDRDNVPATNEEIATYLSFYGWFGFMYNGTFVPTRYAGQEFDVETYQNFAKIISEVCDEESKRWEE